MTLNIEVNSENNLPRSQYGEIFLLRRNGIDCEVFAKGLEKLTGSGDLILSSQRIVFVASTPKMNQSLLFSSVAIQLSDLKSEHFHQPIFGCNYLYGTSSNFSFKFYFKTGGAGVFIPAFFKAIEGVRSSLAQQTISQRDDVNQTLYQEVKRLATADPSDSSVVYIVD